MDHDHIVISFYVADQDLSIHYLPGIGAQMQVYTHLLTICHGGIEKTWIVERRMVITETDQPLPAGWRTWI
jgi:hypothetical protein